MSRAGRSGLRAMQAAPPQREPLDVVDEHDHVLMQLPRDEVHARGLRHRAAHILVLDNSGRVFVQRRAWWKECQPGLWDTSAAGHVDAGETYAAAAERELQEELGIRPAQPLRPLCRLEASAQTGFEFVEVFLAVTDQEPTPDPHEIIDGRWCSPAELADWLATSPADFTAAFRTIWTQYLKVSGLA